MRRDDYMQEDGSRENIDNTILLRKARIAYGAPIRWKREMGKDDSTGDAHRKDDAKNEGEVRYSSRRLACTKCGAEQETKEKQLKIKNGFRAIVCSKCGKQERVHSHKCSCDIIWHHCLLHRNDPQQHLIKRKKGKGKNQ